MKSRSAAPYLLCDETRKYSQLLSGTSEKQLQTQECVVETI